ncbi:hypothetical protein SKAU_G00082800 [Synaphobranchus kaupii]|uniref:Uncharacterized protein n=1 Tax=Synaphobranchus kaupii TaxID=118154 RepID=A0A9Q1J4N0_SYNKA|nr:hypothetical protein SKAU_G00082800 [Synaphobranchus kaupii]
MLILRRKCPRGTESWNLQIYERQGRAGVNSTKASQVKPPVSRDKWDFPVPNKDAVASADELDPVLIPNYREAVSPSSTAAGPEPLTHGASMSTVHLSDTRETGRALLQSPVTDAPEEPDDVREKQGKGKEKMGSWTRFVMAHPLKGEGLIFGDVDEEEATVVGTSTENAAGSTALPEKGLKSTKITFGLTSIPDARASLLHHFNLVVIPDKERRTENYTAELNLDLEREVLPGDFVPTQGKPPTW